MVQGRPCSGNKRQQMLQTAREINWQKRENVEEDSELEESEPEDSEDEDFEEKENCEVTDSEEDPVEVDNSALQTLIASSQQLGFNAFEDNTMVFNYQRPKREYLDSKPAAAAVEEILKFGTGGNRIRVQTAQRRLKKNWSW
ncbi:hypothetical protein FN846DRAFT_904433 [Sphaerosporella brunnea]|uniref:Uncharacterized protein n=1 Tax=Sphaerosporella brunnea TaxID=1250544 RepID=A0A5J5F463_9PEZI|nr:hypothetical protein FN846DRAFT_904433 [Sphaerosporella brunnea]